MPTSITTSLGLCLLWTLACARGTAPKTSPDARPAVSPRDSVTAGRQVMITRREGAPSFANDTGAIATQRREAMARAVEAALKVDSVIVTPTSIELTVGGSIDLSAIRAVGRDSAGRTVPNFVPLFSVADNNIAGFQGPVIYGRSVGRTVLRVSASAGPGAPATPRRVRTEVPLVVRPGSGVVATTDSVPRDLVLALLGSGGRTASLRVAGLPDDLPAAVVKDGVVLGSATYPSASTTVVSMPFNIRATSDSVAARLLAMGWMRPRAPEDFQRGFVSAPRTAATNSVCHGSEFINWRTGPKPPDRTLLTINYNRITGNPTCDTASTRTSRPDPFQGMPVPTLYPPAGVFFESAGTSGGGDEWAARAGVRGAGCTSELAMHFSGQLIEQGWTAVGEASAPDVFSRTMRRATPDGRRWFGVLTCAVITTGALSDLHFSIRQM